MVDEPSSSAEPADATAGADGTDAAVDDTDAEFSADSSASKQHAESDGADPRSVVVPTAIYKRVTVFSTLIAVFAVVGGFLLLDVATDRATAELAEIDPLVALAGVGLIAFGAVTYAFSTRFQAEGMGNAKGETDERSDNG